MAGAKNFEPTTRKLRRARQEGDVAKSRDLCAALSLGLGLMFSIYLISFIGLEFLAKCQKMFEPAKDITSENMLVFISYPMRSGLWLSGAILLVVFFVVLLAELLQVGIQFSFKPLAFKAERLNPAQGLKRLLGYDGEDSKSGGPHRLLLEGAKSLLYIIVPALIGGHFIWEAVQQAIQLEPGCAEELLALIAREAKKGVAAVSSVYLVLGVADYLFQRRKRRKRLMMDREELQREFRESEGDPQYRGMRKAMHQELLHQNLTEQLRRSRVLIVNKEN